MSIKKLYLRITIFVVIATAIGILGQSIISSNAISSIMKSEAETSMENVVDSTMELIGQYIETQYAYMDAYSAETAMLALFEDPTDPAVTAEAQKATENLATVIPNLDSVLFTDYDGTCRVHNVPDLVGYRNTDDIIQMIQDTYFTTPGKPLYSAIAILSPATNQMSICMVKSLFKQNNDPAGYVTVTVTSTDLYAILDRIDLCDDQEILMVNVSDSTIIYAADASLVGETYEEGPAVSLIERINAGESLTCGTMDYTGTNGEDMLGAYTFTPTYGWLLLVGSDKADLYAEAVASRTRILVTGLVILVLIAVVLAALIMWITKPISNIEQTLSRVADYDLTHKKDIQAFTGRTDEIGSLAKATENVIDMFTEVVTLLKNCSSSLSESTVNLQQTSGALTSVTNENADVAARLSSSIEHTASSLQTVNDEIGKIVSYTEMVTEKVEYGKKNSDQLIRSAEKMSGKMEQLSETNSQKLQETMSAMQEAMEGLNAVEKINELADAIMDITSQTNLLSLNASIEAARAGEAGRGFAVVAGEIGQLAEQSKRTAMNIQTIVEESNHSVVNVREQVASLLDYVKNELAESFEAFGEQSKEYDAGISDIRESVAAIGDAMEELQKSVNDIANEIREINNASGSNSDGVVEIMDKNEKTSSVSGDIEELAQGSKLNADSLEKVVDRFRI